MAPVNSRATGLGLGPRSLDDLDRAPQVESGRVGGLPVGEIVQGLQHQNRGHHRYRIR
ncbi:hypothetical protein R1CP_36635 (plasmid) [Rhodococcus opacus]|uniref:Uncharacterized protein n=1 Tax=Rhodococcus opacus TaxID=37919 RepID=A0A1B1KH31_RHOOP|nr:hypothetical protein R1CP_36635 [Rhodococcus opacus]